MKNKLFLLLFCASFMNARAQDTLALDSNITYQTIIGWGHGGGILGHVGGPYSMIDTTVANPVNYQTLDYLTDDLGLTGSRTWEVGPRIDGTGMDNGDCDSIDWSRFQSNSLSPGLANYLVYFKNKVLAQGIQPNFYSSPGYPTHATDQKPWIMYHPGERAQQIWASALYMKNTYNIDINYDVIYNEPSGPVTSTVLADDVKALAPRLTAHGLATRSQFAEAVAPLTDWNFITPVQNDTELWNNVGRISYHNYGAADPYRDSLKQFGALWGITTAQTEMANPTFDDLYNDLTLGGVSYWEVAYSSGNTLSNNSGLTSVTPSSTYFRMRQLLHYVRPGAVRVETTGNDTLIHALAFKRNGKITTVLGNWNASPVNVLLQNIPAGTYTLSKAVQSATANTELDIVTVGAGDTITIPVAGNYAVTTLAPYQGINIPPHIVTYITNPGYIVSPTSTATLTCTANDAELNALTYQWTVVSYPPGAVPVISSPTSSASSVSGLTAAGNYVFQIDVSDGTNVSSKKVYLIEYGQNPPVVIGPAGFRIAAPYGLVFSVPGDTTHANIELPANSVILQVGAGNLSNTVYSGMGTWSLVSQPAGANCLVDSTIWIFGSFRANATNMTMPGDYVFRCDVQNPGYSNLSVEIICTVHPASSAPVINSITPLPTVLTLPVSTTLLTAVTSDPDLDLLRHWWAIVSVPAGAQPQFDYQCRPITNVIGLTVPGTYTFQLRAFDDLHITTQNVSVQVNAATEIENISATPDEISIYPNPFNNELTVAVKNSQSSKIIVYDVTSRKLLQQTFLNSVSLNTEQLTKGIYLYEVRNKNGVIKNGKVVKD